MVLFARRMSSPLGPPLKWNRTGRRNPAPQQSGGSRSAGGAGASSHSVGSQRTQDGPSSSSARNNSNQSSSHGQPLGHPLPAGPGGGSTLSGDPEAVSMFQHWSSDNTADYTDPCQELDLDRLIDDWQRVEGRPNMPSNSQAVGGSWHQSVPSQAQGFSNPVDSGLLGSMNQGASSSRLLAHSENYGTGIAQAQYAQSPSLGLERGASASHLNSNVS